MCNSEFVSSKTNACVVNKNRVGIWTVKSRGSQSSLLPFAVAVCVALKI